MNNNNSDKIIQYLSSGQATVANITEYIGISRQAVHRILNRLIQDGSIVKTGKSPMVYYFIPTQITTEKTTDINFEFDTKTTEIIDQNFLYITPFGQKLTGLSGFIKWCLDRKQDVNKMAPVYLQTIEKYNKFKENRLINGMEKIKSTFDDVALDEIFYIDFYSIEIFGKTKLGQLLLFAKQSQDITLMNQMIDSIKPYILEVMTRFEIDGVAFIPPTVKRERQLMKQIQNRLNLNARIISLVKIKTPVIVPQKTLNKLQDRIINARETIAVNDNGSYNNILLIDDAVGSGATLNEVAKRIRQKNICNGKIIGLAITGSAKGFEIISEV